MNLILSCGEPNLRFIFPRKLNLYYPPFSAIRPLCSLVMLVSPKVHCLIHKSQPHVRIPSQLDPVHAPTSHFLKIHLNIILPSTPRSSKWSLFLMFHHQNPVYASPPTHTSYMPGPSYSSRFDHQNNIGCILPLNLTFGSGFVTASAVWNLLREAVLVILIIVSSFSTQ